MDNRARFLHRKNRVFDSWLWMSYKICTLWRSTGYSPYNVKARFWTNRISHTYVRNKVPKITFCVFFFIYPSVRSRMIWKHISLCLSVCFVYLSVCLYASQQIYIASIICIDLYKLHSSYFCIYVTCVKHFERLERWPPCDFDLDPVVQDDGDSVCCCFPILVVFFMFSIYVLNKCPNLYLLFLFVEYTVTSV